MRGLEAFLDEYGKVPFGVLITKNDLGLEGRVVMVPLWLFLLV